MNFWIKLCWKILEMLMSVLVLFLLDLAAATFWDFHSAQATRPQQLLQITTKRSMQLRATHTMHATNATIQLKFTEIVTTKIFGANISLLLGTLLPITTAPSYQLSKLQGNIWGNISGRCYREKFHCMALAAWPNECQLVLGGILSDLYKTSTPGRACTHDKCLTWHI